MDGIDRYEAEQLAEGKASAAADQVERNLEGRLDSLRRDLENELSSIRGRCHTIEEVAGEHRSETAGALESAGEAVGLLRAQLGDAIGVLNGRCDALAERIPELLGSGVGDLRIDFERRIGELGNVVQAEARERTTADLSLAGEIRHLASGDGPPLRLVEPPAEDTPAESSELPDRIHALAGDVRELQARAERDTGWQLEYLERVDQVEQRLAQLETKHAHRTAELGESVTGLEAMARNFDGRLRELGAHVDQVESDRREVGAQVSELSKATHLDLLKLADVTGRLERRLDELVLERDQETYPEG